MDPLERENPAGGSRKPRQLSSYRGGSHVTHLFTRSAALEPTKTVLVRSRMIFLSTVIMYEGYGEH
eukprot:scaffold394538_cov48-Prasinocladus_malaysianus.AAC.1